jgi:glycosyltransferase involved in cell wall biosynthesis
VTAGTVRVAFDATSIPGRRVGAGVYVAELLKAMDGLDVDLHVFVNARDAEEFSSIASAATLHSVRVPNRPGRLVWAHSVLPLRVRRLRPDVFHGPHYTVPPGLGCASVVTFHDPTFFTLPQLHERTKVLYFTRAARAGIARAARVIAVSSYARRGAIDHAGAEEEKVEVVFEGVDAGRYHPAAGGDAFPFEPYILFVGTIEPRKDVPTLLAAYQGLVQSGFSHHLVLAGPPAWGAAEVAAGIEGMRSGTVHQLAYVPEEQKIELYRRASVFVYPSIAEGFGLPVLEAMACGAPVVTTSGSAPEEIAADAALLVPPRSPEALREAIARALTDESLVADLRRRAIARAQTFTWARTAEATLEVYRRAAGSPP